MNRNKAVLVRAVVGVACSVIGAGLYDRTSSVVSYNDNPWRSKGAQVLKHKKKRRKAADKSKRINRRKR